MSGTHCSRQSPRKPCRILLSDQRVFLFPPVEMIVIDCGRGDVQLEKAKHCPYWPPFSGAWSTHIISAYWRSKTYKVRFAAILRYINKTPKPFPRLTKTEDQVIKKGAWFFVWVDGARKHGRGDQHLKMRSGTGGTLRWVKRSLCKHEDWSLDPQSHINARWVWQPHCKPRSRGRDAGSFQAN